VVASHEVAPEFREYERASTVALDAYLGPTTARYLRALGEKVRHSGLPAPMVMRSSGGVATLEDAAAHPAWALVSGPAGGVAGAARAARLAGFENAISLDMGGTSTDVCLIANGDPERSTERTVGGFPCVCRRSTSTPWAPAAARSHGLTRAVRFELGREAREPTRGLPAMTGAARIRR
jgi:N-methylhydantoinase A